MTDSTQGGKQWIRRPRMLIGLSFVSILLVTAFAAGQALAGMPAPQQLQGSNSKTSLPNGAGHAAAIAPNIANSANRASPPSRPNAVDASVFLTTSTTAGTCPAPAIGGTVAVGCTFVLDMFVNAGTNAAPDGLTAQQSYMTFTYQTIQNAKVISITTSCVPTNSVTTDLLVFDASLQNEVCDGPAPCVFRGTTVDPGSLAFASGALSNCPEGCPDPAQPPPQDQPIFRVGQVGVCAISPGLGGLYWQFSNFAPNDRCQNGAPLTRDTEIVSLLGNLAQDCTRFTNYTFTITGPTSTPGPPTLTPSPTPTIEPTVPAVTPTFTRTNTPSVTPTSTLTRTVTPTNTQPPTNTVPPASTPTFTSGPINTPTFTRTVTPTNTQPPTNTVPPASTPTFTVPPVNTPTFTRTITPTNTQPPTNTVPPASTPTFTVPPVNTPTFTRTSTPTSTVPPPSSTMTSPPQFTATRTNTPGVATSTRTNTPVPPTHTPCPVNFSDVHASPTPDYFYAAVRYLYCEGIVSGYGNNTFRPYDTTTRAQISKVIVLARGWAIDTHGGPHFNDVPTNNMFYPYIETIFNRSIITGYDCGGPGEPCPGQYFRPNGNVTRGQLTQIVVRAMGWATNTSGGPHFLDVPTTDVFYGTVETALNHGAVSGYSCDGPPDNCPGRYFHPSDNASRGQIAKVVYLAITSH